MLRIAGLAIAVLCTSSWVKPHDKFVTTTPLDIRKIVDEGTSAFLRPSPISDEIRPAISTPCVSFIRARVTACSPNDPKDKEYYSKHGYKGATYNIAAFYNQFPKGTLIRVPGYMEDSYPGKYWEVDSPGGSVIRKSARKGIYHIDVKFKNTNSANKWGSRWMIIEVISPN